MRTEWKLFAIVSGFLLFATFLYGFWTEGASGGVEWIGTTALALSFLLTAMCGGFFWFVSRRIDPRPEDRPDAEISDGAGEVGFFREGTHVLCVPPVSQLPVRMREAARAVLEASAQAGAPSSSLG